MSNIQLNLSFENYYLLSHSLRRNFLILTLIAILTVVIWILRALSVELSSQKVAHGVKFKLMDEYKGEKAELSLSLDVIFHLVEDQTFESYIQTVFNSSNCYVIIYSSNYNSSSNYEGAHIKHRKFTRWIEENRKDYKLLEYIPNKYPFEKNNTIGSLSNFYIYSKLNL